MTAEEYLKKNFKEEMPRWLSEYLPGTPFPLEAFLKSRMVYYPGSGYDGHAIKTFGSSHSAHCFIMADYGVSEDSITDMVYGRLKGGYSAPLKGYDVLEYQSIPLQRMIDAEPCKWHLTDEELRIASVAASRWASSRPYVCAIIFERKPEFTEEHGPLRLAVLFMGEDGITEYDALFANHNVPNFFAMLLQDHGFGGNWNKFGKGGLMETIANRAQVWPEIILSCDAHQNGMWPNYEKVDAEPTNGGMWSHRSFGNYRSLWLRKK